MSLQYSHDVVRPTEGSKDIVSPLQGRVANLASSQAIHCHQDGCYANVCSTPKNKHPLIGNGCLGFEFAEKEMNNTNIPLSRLPCERFSASSTPIVINNLALPRTCMPDIMIQELISKADYPPLRTTSLMIFRLFLTICMLLSRWLMPTVRAGTAWYRWVLAIL